MSASSFTSMPMRGRPSLCTILEDDALGELPLHSRSRSDRRRRRQRSLSPSFDEEIPESGRRRTFQTLLRVNILLVCSFLAFYSSGELIQGRGRLLSLPTTKSSKKRKTSSKHTILYNDGTLFAPQGSDSMCQYFIDSERAYTSVRRIHYHFPTCADDDANLQEHFGAQLLAKSAGLHYTLTCGTDGEAKGETLLARLSGDYDTYPSVTSSFSPLQLCQPCPKAYPSATKCDLQLDLMLDDITNAVSKHATESFDAVLYVDPSYSVDDYIELVKQQSQEDAPQIESFILIGEIASSHMYDLNGKLKETFPGASVHVRSRQNKQSFVEARQITICVSSSCPTLALGSAQPSALRLIRSHAAWHGRLADTLNNVRLVSDEL